MDLSWNRSTSYIFETLDAGKTYIYNERIKNLDNKTITIEPNLTAVSSLMSAGTNGQAFGNDAVRISAPKTIKAGEIANLTITVTVPDNTSGSYRRSIALNVNGVKSNQYNPQLILSFTARKLPTVLYVNNFSTTFDAPVTIDVSADTYNSNMGIRISPKIEPPFIPSWTYS